MPTILILMIPTPLNVGLERCAIIEAMEELDQSGRTTIVTRDKEFWLILRNQREESNMVLRLECSLTLYGDTGEDATRVILKSVQRLFDWLKEYVLNNHVLDETGNMFIAPPFFYSEGSFENVPGLLRNLNKPHVHADTYIPAGWNGSY